MMRSRFALFALAVLALAACNKTGETGAPPKASEPVKAVAAPTGTNWSDKVVATDDGVRMGNPDAKLILIEYGSYTCPHCRDFQAEGHEAVERDYVNSGKVSFEYRSMIRDPLDLATALVAHCAPTEAFFALNTQLFANQNDMIQKYLAHSEADQRAAGALPPEQRFVRLAEMAGLIDFAKQRGLAEDKVRACLTDTGKAKKLADITEAVIKKYPAFPGTPSFILNDTLLDSTANWEQLQLRMRDAGI